MDKAGAWRLAPAFDVTYAYNPKGDWTAQHQMSINGKRDAFALEDFRACAKTAGLKRGRTETMLDEVVAAVKDWPDHADAARVSRKSRDAIAATLRLEFQ